MNADMYFSPYPNGTRLLFDPDGECFYADTDEGRKVLAEETFPISEWDAGSFKFAGIRGYAPMLATEISDEVQDNYFSDKCNIIEEKLDGTRALVHFFAQDEILGSGRTFRFGYCRVFSRRVSEKTGFFVENTDLLPQIKCIDAQDLEGTVIDGELRMERQEFREVASTLNCKWDKAIRRQMEFGFIVLHAFDILRYKGVDVRRCPLSYRKQLLHRVLWTPSGFPLSRFLQEHPWYKCGGKLAFPYGGVKSVDTATVSGHYDPVSVDQWKYPEAFRCIKNDEFTPRGYYELIVSRGGEGVIVKPSDGTYKCGKRQKEYLKVKKFLTRDVIVMGFTEPTKEYRGKYVKNRWDYWIDSDDNRQDVETYKYLPADELLRRGFIPVTKFYYYGWVGNIRYGVVITEDEVLSLPGDKAKKINIEDFEIDGQNVLVAEVGDCAGFSDDMKMRFSFSRRVVRSHHVGKHFPKDYAPGDVVVIAPWEAESNKALWEVSEPYDWRGSVVEVKANDMFKDTGKMRHPRFLCLRPDKSWKECTWREHVS